MQQLSGFAEQGGNTVSSGGLVSTTTVQKSFPSCTVTVYLAGTTTVATIFSTSAGAAKANPFTAGTDGSWNFFARPGTYDVTFSGTGITTPFTSAGLVIYIADVKDYGAVGNGVANDTAAIVAANAALSATGGVIYLPAGTYLLTPAQLVCATIGTVIRGDGMGNTFIKRRTDVNGDLIEATGTSFMMEDICIQDFSITATNTAVSLHLNNINDVKLHHVWLQTGFNLLFLDHGSNYSLHGCIIESNRSNGITAVQASDVSVVNTEFYFGGVGGSGLADILIQKDAAFAYRPYGWRIVGCSFEQGRSGHHIRSIQSSGLTIVGNEFSFAGMLAVNTFDDIKLESCQWTTITGNNFPAEFDALNNLAFGQGGYARATRYNINIDGACQSTRLFGNVANPGTTGIINNLAADTIGAGFGAVIASVAGVITPTFRRQHVSGANAITGITATTFVDGDTWEVIPDGAFTWTNATNIAIAGTAVVNRELTFTWDATAVKWFPSYT